MQQTTDFLESICGAEDILLFNGKYERLRAAALNMGDTKGIATDSALTGWTRIAAIAHELGHHMMGHFDGLVESNERKEYEAQTFATVFTAMAVFRHYERSIVEGGVKA